MGILSKQVTPSVLKLIQDSIGLSRIKMTTEEAIKLYNMTTDFKVKNNRLPDINSEDEKEKRMAEAIIFLNNLQRERTRNG